MRIFAQPRNFVDLLDKAVAKAHAFAVSLDIHGKSASLDERGVDDGGVVNAANGMTVDACHNVASAQAHTIDEVAVG